MVKRTRYIPAIITLVGCFAASLISIVNQYDAMKSMIIILAMSVGFYIVGLIIRGLADHYLVIPEEELAEETEEENGEGETDEAGATEEQQEKSTDTQSE